MTTIIAAPKERIVKSIVSGLSASGYAVVSMGEVVGSTVNTAKVVQSGAMVAGVLKPILSIEGKGRISLFGWGTVNATSRNCRVRVTIDGVIVFDSTSANSTSTYRGGVIVGALSGGAVTLEELFFDNSALFECADSLSETDGLLFAYKYVTF